MQQAERVRSAATLVGWAAAAVITLSVISIVTNGQERSRVLEWFDARGDRQIRLEGDWLDAAGRAEAARTWTGIATVVLVIALAVTCSRAARLAEDAGAHKPAMSPAWAAGYWFVPVVQFFAGPSAMNHARAIARIEVKPIGEWRPGPIGLEVMVAVSWMLAVGAGILSAAADPFPGAATREELHHPIFLSLVSSSALGVMGLLCLIWAAEVSSKAARTASIDDPLLAAASTLEIRNDAQFLPAEERSTVLQRIGDIGQSAFWFVADDRLRGEQVLVKGDASAHRSGLRRSRLSEINWFITDLHPARFSARRIDGRPRMVGDDLFIGATGPLARLRPRPAVDRLAETWQLRLGTTEPANPPSRHSSSSDASTTVEVLDELLDLRRRNLINESEYAEMRESVMQRLRRRAALPDNTQQP